MAHASIEVVCGIAAYVVDVAGEWRFFRTAVCADYGGNVYQRRTAPASTCGLGAAGPRGVPCRVRYRDELVVHSLTDPATRQRLIGYLREHGQDAVGLESDTTAHLLRRLCHLTGAYGSGDEESGIYLDEDAGEFAGWWRS